MLVSVNMVKIRLNKAVKKVTKVESVMLGRCIITVAGIIAAMPAFAGELKPEEAKHFIAGKYFSYSCFEGSSGAGRVNADG